MANRSRRKGDRRERQIVDRLKGLGLDASRVPLSGAAGGHFAGDVTVRWTDPLGWQKRLNLEVKARAEGAGWKTIRGWLADQDGLVLVEDRTAPLVVLRWDVFERLLGEKVTAEIAAKGGNGREESATTETDAAARLRTIIEDGCGGST